MKDITIQKLLDNLIQESVKSALYKRADKERSLQDATFGQVNSLNEKDVTSDEEVKDDSSPSNALQTSKTVTDEKEKLKIGVVKTDDVIEKLNYIRAGRSFKDEQIHANMDQYVKSLSKEERVALYAFLKGISQIVSGEIEPEKAIDPEDDPANIEMEKTNEKKVKSIKPNVIKKAGQEKDIKKSSSNAEDDSSPTPISPKGSSK